MEFQQWRKRSCPLWITLLFSAVAFFSHWSLTEPCSFKIPIVSTFSLQTFFLAFCSLIDQLDVRGHAAVLIIASVSLCSDLHSERCFRVCTEQNKKWHSLWTKMRKVIALSYVFLGYCACFWINVHFSTLNLWIWWGPSASYWSLSLYLRTAAHSDTQRRQSSGGWEKKTESETGAVNADERRDCRNNWKHHCCGSLNFLPATPTV